MKLERAGAELFVPDDTPVPEALRRTTHLAIGAHQDDLEVMAFAGIAECFQQPDRWFGGVVVSDGAGAPRAGIYADHDDARMRATRATEQKNAATVGAYSFQALLDHPSAAIKDPDRGEVVDDLQTLLSACAPRRIYTHNLADKHATHVAVALRVVEALRRLPAERRPAELWGCEVWRNLDWMRDADKVCMDCSPAPNLAAAVLGVFDSQIRGGKRYDLAAMGRWSSNATFFESHAVDQSPAIAFAMDLSPLLRDDALSPQRLVERHLDGLREDVLGAIGRFEGA